MQALWPLTSFLPWVAGMQMLSWYALLLLSCSFPFPGTLACKSQCAGLQDVLWFILMSPNASAPILCSDGWHACVCDTMQLPFTCQSLANNQHSVCTEAAFMSCRTL